jgi:hypothetical protein
MIQDIQLNFTRIDLNGDLCIGVKIEMAAQQIHQAADLRLVQIGWRTAAPVQLVNLTAGKQRRAMNNLLLKHIQILVGLMLLAGDDLLQPQK